MTEEATTERRVLPGETKSKLRPATTTKKFDVKQFIDPAQLKKDMSYSTVNLSDALSKQGSLFVHYGVLAAHASRQVNNAKMNLDIIKARVYRTLRDEGAKSGVKMTEAMLDKAVDVHPTVISMRRALNEATQIESVGKTAVEGFRHRRDMLIQEGLISREEMKGEVSINRRNANEENLAAQKARVLARMQRNISSEDSSSS